MGRIYSGILCRYVYSRRVEHSVYSFAFPSPTMHILRKIKYGNNLLKYISNYVNMKDCGFSTKSSYTYTRVCLKMVFQLCMIELATITQAGSIINATKFWENIHFLCFPILDL